MSASGQEATEALSSFLDTLSQRPLEKLHLGQYASMLEEYRMLRVREEKKRQELNKLKMGIEKATEANAKTVNYCDKKEKQNQTKERKYQTDRSYIEGALDIWRQWGLELEILKPVRSHQNGNNDYDEENRANDEQENSAKIEAYLLKFTKIDPKRPEKVFSAQVEMHQDHIKIVHVEPGNLLNEEQINFIEKKLKKEVELSALANKNLSQTSTDDDDPASPKDAKEQETTNLSSPDFRLLVVLLRKMFRTCVRE